MKQWSTGESNITNGEESRDLICEDNGVIAHFYDDNDAELASNAPKMLSWLKKLTCGLPMSATEKMDCKDFIGRMEAL